MDYVNLSLNMSAPLQSFWPRKRFDLARYMTFRDGYFDAASSYLIQNLKTLPLVGYYIITDEPYRPDMIAWDIYGDTQFWWMIMVYNNIIDIRNLPQLTKLTFFSLNDLDRMFAQMVSTQGSQK